jgi:hypothetical protein
MADPPRSNDVLGKADALLARYKAARAARQPEPPADYPVLTEVFESPKPRPFSDLDLEIIERELRLELLELLSGELERLVEVRVRDRLEDRVAEAVAAIAKELETEIRRAVREALAEVIHGEIARLREDDKG